MMKLIPHKLCCNNEDCPYCRGYSICTVCLAGEGELLAFCPGFALNSEAAEACYNGNVIDMSYRATAMRIKKMKDKGRT